MKNLIVIVQKTVECGTVHGKCHEYDQCGDYVTTHSISYPVTANKEDIYATMFPVIGDFSMSIDHVGGRPNHRR